MKLVRKDLIIMAFCPSILALFSHSSDCRTCGRTWTISTHMFVAWLSSAWTRFQSQIQIGQSYSCAHRWKAIRMSIRSMWQGLCSFRKSENTQTNPYGVSSHLSNSRVRSSTCFFDCLENDPFNVNSASEVLPIVLIERNISMCIHRTNRTIVESVDVTKPTLIHHVRSPWRERELHILFFFVALRKHMKMHEAQGQDSASTTATNSSTGSGNDSCMKRNTLHRRAMESERSPSPSSRMHPHSQRRRRSSRDSISSHLHQQQQQQQLQHPHHQQQQHLQINHSSMNTTTTTDSCSESPPSFENLTPMKAALARMHHPQAAPIATPSASSTDWPLHMHTMSAYHHPHVYHPHHAAALQQHYYHRQTGLNF